MTFNFLVKGTRTVEFEFEMEADNAELALSQARLEAGHPGNVCIIDESFEVRKIEPDPNVEAVELPEADRRLDLYGLPDPLWSAGSGSGIIQANPG